MGKKYIIELEGDAFVNGSGCKNLYRVKGFNSLVFDEHGLEMLTPYTEPDMEQVRTEAYEKGFDDGRTLNTGKYEKGLNDAWEAAKKIWEYDTTTLREIFGEGIMIMDYYMIFTASEAIEKIRQYEQRQEEQIQVGDEVENTQTSARFIVTHMWVSNHGEKGVSGFNYECSAFSTALDLVRKTGRHFPEIAEVFAKMKETNNG